MNIVQWIGIGDYDYLIETNPEEISYLIDKLPNLTLSQSEHGIISASRWECTYLLISRKRKCIAGLPFLSYAFGGGYNEALPIKKTDDKILLSEIVTYKSEKIM